MGGMPEIDAIVTTLGGVARQAMDEPLWLGGLAALVVALLYAGGRRARPRVRKRW